MEAGRSNIADRISFALTLCLASVCVRDAVSHEIAAPVSTDSGSVVAQWQLRARYALPGRARHAFAENRDPMLARDREFLRETPPLRLSGHAPTERLRDLVDPREMPQAAFSFEAWLNCHVNQPVGVAALAGGPQSPRDAGWAVAFHTFDGGAPRVVARFGHPGQSNEIELSCALRPDDGFKEYWRHIVLTYDGRVARLYTNGHEMASRELSEAEFVMPSESHFEIAAYLENEPEMELANLVSHARLYRQAVSAEGVQQRFEEFQHDLEHGVVHPGVFQFAAGPYLNYATQRSIRVVWETDQPASAKIEWGETSALGQSAVLDQPSTIQEYEIDGLGAHTPYFYRITCVNRQGEELSSGILTFQTAVRREEPFRFVVIGDTETRPHVNHALSQKIWGERPNFVVVLGDLTDGGMRDHKWQWNQEYFAGIAGLCSRVPFFPVPGNGEADLYWYKRYHSLPDDESPYAFRYGDAEFFMLDSNLRATEFSAGGRQYQWLEQRLDDSDAAWKFVCFHHAPFTSDEDDYGDAWNRSSIHGDEEVRRLAPLFERYGVDVVMFGHIHSYERSRPISSLASTENGVLYLLCGGGGGNLEDFAPNPVAFSSKVHRGHHYCLVNVEGRKLESRVYNLDGALIDIFSIEKPPSKR